MISRVWIIIATIDLNVQEVGVFTDYDAAEEAYTLALSRGDARVCFFARDLDEGVV